MLMKGSFAVWDSVGRYIDYWGVRTTKLRKYLIG